MVNKVEGVNLKVDNIPSKMTSVLIIRGEFKGWHVVNVDDWKRELKFELTDEEKDYSEWGIWNFQLLLERLEDNWTPRKWVEEMETEYLGKGN